MLRYTSLTYLPCDPFLLSGVSSKGSELRAPLWKVVYNGAILVL